MAITSMEELLKKHGAKVKGFTRGEKIEAKIIAIGKKEAVFDVGGKGEGLLKDIYFQEARDYMRTLKVGDIVNAVVMDPETKEGNVLLSLRHAASDSLWHRLQDLKNSKAVVNVSIKNSNQSGISVEYEGISGFIPSSQVGKITLKEIDNLGGSLRVKIVEIDKNKKRVVFSEKAVSEEKEIASLNKAVAKIKQGEIYKGKVTNITSFGIFVAIKVDEHEVEGLVHVSESSWEKISSPADVFKVGQVVEVKVLEAREGKLSLSIKQAQKDPWESEVKKLKVDDKIKGTVSKISDFGTFVRIANGVEGLIHITKIPPAMKFNIGDSVNCYIEEIDTKNKKISLGIVLSAKPIGYK